MVGQIVLSLGQTLWLDPLVERVFLREICITTNVCNVRTELLKQELAEGNPEHINLLKMKCTDVINLPVEENPEKKEVNALVTVETAILDEDEYEDITVSSVVSPSIFFVQLFSYENDLYDLEEAINEEVKKKKLLDESDDEDISVGSLCLAKYSQDNRWYRARVLGTRPDSEYDVFFVDYGNREWLKRVYLQSAWPELGQLPLQGIECSLANVHPLDNDWCDEDSDALWEIVQNKLLNAKVTSKCGSSIAGTHRFNIELTDTSSERTVNIGHQLVVSGHGQPSLDSLHALFPGASLTRDLKQYQHEYERIPDICLQIHKTQDLSQKVHLAKELQNIIPKDKVSQNAVRENNGIHCLCRLLSLSRTPAVQEHVLISLVFLAFENEQNCEEICKHDGLKAMCRLLQQTNNEGIQENIAWALKNIGIIKRNQDTIRDAGGIKTICQILQNTQSTKVMENIVWALVSLCKENNRNCEAVKEAGGLSKLCAMISEVTSERLLEHLMSAIYTLAVDVKNRNQVRLDGGLDSLCRKLKDWIHEKLPKQVYLTLRLLKLLISDNQANKRLVHQYKVQEQLQGFLGSEKKCDVQMRRLCSDFIQKLSETHQTPSPQLRNITNIQSPRTPLSINQGDRMRVCPQTVWSQKKNNITLSVKLRGVDRSFATCDITAQTLAFRYTTQEKEYFLDFTFYNTVTPESKVFSVMGSEVLITVDKEEPNFWPRLLKGLRKPPYLSRDFDRWNNESSDEDEIPDTIVREGTRINRHSSNSHRQENTSHLSNNNNRVILPEMDSTDSSEDQLEDLDFKMDDDFGF